MNEHPNIPPSLLDQGPGAAVMAAHALVSVVGAVENDAHHRNRAAFDDGVNLIAHMVEELLDYALGEMQVSDFVNSHKNGVRPADLPTVSTP